MPNEKTKQTTKRESENSINDCDQWNIHQNASKRREKSEMWHKNNKNTE